jgi:hypothetical protein
MPIEFWCEPNEQEIPIVPPTPSLRFSWACASEECSRFDKIQKIKTSTEVYKRIKIRKIVLPQVKRCFYIFTQKL